MSTTPASTRPDISAGNLARMLTDEITGDPTLADRAVAAMPAAIALYETVREFVEGEHGQVIAAYHAAFDAIEDRPDWLGEIERPGLDDVDMLMHGIVGLLEQLSQSYPECPALDQSLAETVIASHRGGVAQ